MSMSFHYSELVFLIQTNKIFFLDKANPRPFFVIRHLHQLGAGGFDPFFISKLSIIVLLKKDQSIGLDQ